MSTKKIFLSDIHLGPDRPLGSESHPYEWCEKKMADACSDFLNWGKPNIRAARDQNS